MNLNWSVVSSFRDDDSEIPTDITCRILDTEDEEVGTVRAHKMFLAAHSDFFRKAFYGSGKDMKTKDGYFDVKGTSLQAFSSMVDFIYEKNVKFDGKSVDELYDILNIAKLYGVENLESKVGDRLKNFPITMDSLAEVAATAEEFHQFDDESSDLLTKCAIFLDQNIRGVEFQMKYLLGCTGREATVARLIRAAREVLCTNCTKKPCGTGQFIDNITDISVGMKIETGSSMWMESYKNQKCRVISVEKSGQLTFEWVSPPTPSLGVSNPYTYHFGLRWYKYKCSV
jgi:hypothetical protein